ncbi:MAG TPA: Arm DNA-binding domain-containing protein [Puia sp.]|nr:Arm DNA-binding domain-containing protein [Puia sp.]
MKVSENLSILFIVEKSSKSKDGLAPIHVRITVNGQRNEISLGVKILPELWDTQKGRVTGNLKEAACAAG